MFKKPKFKKMRPLNKKEVALSLLLCLEENNTESFIEILDDYLQVNRREMARKTKLSRATVQNTFNPKKNPTIKTLAKIIHQAVASNKNQ